MMYTLTNIVVKDQLVCTLTSTHGDSLVVKAPKEMFAYKTFNKSSGLGVGAGFGVVKSKKLRTTKDRKMSVDAGKTRGKNITKIKKTYLDTVL